MEDDVTDQPEEDAQDMPQPEIEVPPPNVLSSMGADELAQFLLPSQLNDLYDILLAGPASHLVAPTYDSLPGASTEGQVYSMNESLVPVGQANAGDRPPIRFVHTTSLTPEQPTAEWIVVVEAKTANRGSVKRLAEEIGFYVSTHLCLFLLLLPYSTLTFPACLQLEQTVPPNLALDSTAEYLESFDLTEEEKQLVPTGGAQVVTRALQEGIRMLHAADPSLYTIDDLARAFRIPRRMIERILKLDIELPEHQAKRREQRAEQSINSRSAVFPGQDQGLLQRVEEAFLRQRDQVHASPITDPTEPQVLVQGYDAEKDTLPVKVLFSTSENTLIDRDSGRELVTPTKSQKPVQNVNYEGLVPFTEATRVRTNNPGTNRYVSFRGQRIAARVDNERKRGDGNWAVVDAGWVQIHVVTPKARKHYPFEKHWEQAMDQVLYEQTYGEDFLRSQPQDKDWALPKQERRARPHMRSPDPSDEDYDKWA